MAPRAVGALFALVAAVVLLVSLGGGVVPKVVPGWWDGHPRVDGKTIERKEIHVGLLAGHGCNLGETVTCQELPTGSMLAPIGIGELAAIGVTVASLFALMISAWAIGDRRKWLAKLVLGETIVIAIGGALLLVLGPQIKSTQHVAVPIGLGMMLFWAGVASASIAGVVTMRLEREPLRLRNSAPAVNPPPPQQPATFDFNELLRDEPQHVPVPSPGGHLAGPAGPLAPPPMFDQGAPQLRPLYDISTPPPPQLPTRPPTPVSRDSIDAITNVPSMPPPPRPSSPSVPPPRSSSPSVPPPPAGPARAKAASLPPPLAPAAPGRPMRASTPSKHPTLAHAIPPPPTPANLTAPSVLPARDSAVKIPIDPTERSTAVRDVPDPVTAVEIDAEAKARHAAAGKVPLPGMPLAPRPQDTAKARDSTELDATVERPRESIEPAPEPRDSAATIARPRVSAPVIDEPRDSAATIARPRVSAPDLEATSQSEPIIEKPAEDLNATIERSPAPPPAPEPEPDPAIRASQVPISTAPASLPPPRKTTTQTAGPTPACPQCEAPMAWVEEHLRFYCPQCRMYF